MTGKQGKTGGYWPLECVLPLTARKLALSFQPEYLHLDVVLFPPGEPWGNLVVIEHENAVGTFEQEIEKLMSVLAPLKVGITYLWKNRPGTVAAIVEKILKYFATRNPAIKEPIGTEYLFLVGVEKEHRALKWNYFSLAYPNVYESPRIIEIDKQFRFSGNHDE